MTSYEKSLGQGLLREEWYYELPFLSKTIFIFYLFIYVILSDQ